MRLKLKPSLPIFIIFTLLSLSISFRKPFWRDEIFSYYLSNQPLVNLVSSTAQDFTPPLFYILLHIFIKIFKSNEVLLRLLPLSFSLAIIFLFFHITNYFKLSKLKNFFFLLITSFSFPLLYFSAELRAYSMQMFLTLFSVICLYNCLTLKNKKWPILFTISNIALLYTHSTALLFFISQALSIFIIFIFQKRRVIFIQILNLKKLSFSLSQLYKQFFPFSVIFIAFTLSLLAFSPWLNIMFNQSKQAQSSFWINLTRKEMLFEYHGLFFILEHLPTLVQKLLIFKHLFRFYLGLTFLGLVIIIKKFPQTISLLLSLLLTLFFVYFYSISISPILYHRYLAFLSPFVYILIAFFFVNIFKKNNFISILLSTFYFLISSTFIYLYLIKVPSKTNFSAITKVSSPIYTASSTHLLPCTFYHPSCTYVGEISAIPRYLGISQLDPNLFQSLQSWDLITDSNFYILYNSDIKNSIQEKLTSYLQREKIDLGNNTFLQYYSKN